MHRRLLWVIVCAALAGLARGARAQQPAPARQPYAARADLEAALERLTRAAESPAYSAALRARAASQADAVRRRLQTGDFQVGDRLWLEVESETSLTDTVTVATGPALSLPVIGSISLGGVLRSELESHLAASIEKLVRLPKVRARSLLRVTVSGGVVKPGSYLVAADDLLSEVLALAGGASSTGRPERLRMRRDGRAVLEGVELERALREGRTLDQLSIQAGDEFVVPERAGSLGTLEGPIRTLSMLLTIPALVIGLTRIF